MVTELPVYKIKGKFYHRDERLGEYRSVSNPNKNISINSNPKLQTSKPGDYGKMERERSQGGKVSYHKHSASCGHKANPLVFSGNIFSKGMGGGR